MQPGHKMDVTVDLTKTDVAVATATFKAKGTNDRGEQTVATQFTLHGYGLSDRGASGLAANEKLLAHWKTNWAVLTGELKRKQ